MEFGRLALWPASRHSTSHQYDYWKLMYLSSSYFLSPGFSLHTFIFTKADSFLHNHWKCVCSQWCSVPLYHLIRLLVGFGSGKGLKAEGIYLEHCLCDSLTGLLPLWGNQRPHKKPRWRSSHEKDSVTKAFFSLMTVTWLMCPWTWEKPTLWKPLRNSEVVSLLLHLMPAQQTHLCKMFQLCNISATCY